MVQALTLNQVGTFPSYILDFFEIMVSQTKYTVRYGIVSAKKSKGNIPRLDSIKVNKLEDLVLFSCEAR